MKYITHHRYKELALCQEQLNLSYNTEIICKDNILYTLNNKPICILRSENGKKHFARNDDSKGLERGALTYAIAYSPREKKCKDGSIRRFSDKEQEILCSDWAHFLRSDTNVILFNDAFFEADVEELQKLANALKNADKEN